MERTRLESISALLTRLARERIEEAKRLNILGWDSDVAKLLEEAGQLNSAYYFMEVKEAQK